MDSVGRHVQTGLLGAIPPVLLFMLILGVGAWSMRGDLPLPPLLLSWPYIYYWSLFMPARLGYLTLALAGLLQDIALGFPLAVSSLCFLLLRWSILQLRQRISVQHFLVVWAGFAVLVIALVIVMALALGVAQGNLRLDDFRQAGYAALIAVIAYPLVHVLCNRLYNLVKLTHR